ILWFSPESRGVLDFNEFHVSRSLRRVVHRGGYQITFNRAFPQVLGACAASARPGQVGTWITDPIHEAYLKFHDAGYAHSVECWVNEELVGGLYGVYVGGVVSGESMFYTRPNASKLCLVHLVEALRANHLSWMDIQMVTDHLRTMGGKYISRSQF